MDKFNKNTELLLTTVIMIKTKSDNIKQVSHTCLCLSYSVTQVSISQWSLRPQWRLYMYTVRKGKHCDHCPLANHTITSARLFFTSYK